MFLECRFGLVDSLIQNIVLEYAQGWNLNTVKDDETQRSQLLEIMISIPQKGKHELFHSSLRMTNQSHIARYLTQNGGKEICGVIFC